MALDPAELAAPEPDAALLALDEALDRLSALDAQKAELVKLRYFCRAHDPAGGGGIRDLYGNRLATLDVRPRLAAPGGLRQQRHRPVRWKPTPSERKFRSAQQLVRA
jgi:hypothetical protein